MAGGLVMTTVGLVLIASADSVGGLTLVVTGFALACAGVGPLSSLGIGIVVGSAPPEKAGSASGISETSSELGWALGIATMGSIALAVYRGQLGDSLSSGVPDDVAASAGEGIAGAAAAAAAVPEPEVAAANEDDGGPL